MEEIESNPILARLRTSSLNKKNSLNSNLSNPPTNKLNQNINTPKHEVSEPPQKSKEKKETNDSSEKPVSIYSPPIRSCSNSKLNKNISVNSSSTRDSFPTPNQTAIQNDFSHVPRRSQANQNRAISSNHEEDESFSVKTYNTLNNQNISEKRFSDTFKQGNYSTPDNYKKINGQVKDLAQEFEDLLNKESDIESNIKTENNRNDNFKRQKSTISFKNMNNFPNHIPSNRIKLPPEFTKRSISPVAYKTDNNFQTMQIQKGNYSGNLPDNREYNSYYSNHNDYFSTQTYSKRQSNYLINLEDLILLEEKLSDIMYNIKENRVMINECFEWWNFYFNCSLCGKLEHYFKQESEQISIKEYSILELLTIIICYDISYDKDLLTKIQPLLKSILNLIQQNYLIICVYILSKVASESLSNTWVQKLRYLTEKKLINKENSKNVNLTNKNFYLLSYAIEIKANNKSIQDYLRIILKNYPQRQEKTDLLIAYFKNINRINVETLNDFFRSKIIRVLNKNASVLASVLFNKDGMYTENQIPVPYLKNESLKRLTLVLDLDETLIHFKMDEKDDCKGLLRLRPGLFEFLDCVEKYYELVIFTAATPEVNFIFKS